MKVINSDLDEYARGKHYLETKLNNKVHELKVLKTLFMQIQQCLQLTTARLITYTNVNLKWIRQQ